MEKLKGQLSEFQRAPGASSEERDVAARMLAYLDTKGEQAFYRTQRPAHFTGSAFVISPDGKKVLLMRHKKLAKWLQPGGHADGDADLGRVAVRETLEETGVEVESADAQLFGVDWHPIPSTPKEDAHEHADCVYLLQARTWQLVRQEEEADSVGWFDAREALALSEDGSVRRLIARYFKETL
ncbi:MAG TPA: NUDIX hydrolase [Bdellovibrionota bacterium]|jgi:8-oxo-dGTP pyrophosphatase MutT (NUDIX family)|nr:NUDIX hydrolase [Bdellovibrionota bacterium]